MKKLLTLISVIFALIFLTGCEDKNKRDIEKEAEIINEVMESIKETDLVEIYTFDSNGKFEIDDFKYTKILSITDKEKINEILNIMNTSKPKEIIKDELAVTNTLMPSYKILKLYNNDTFLYTFKFNFYDYSIFKNDEFIISASFDSTDKLFSLFNMKYGDRK